MRRREFAQCLSVAASGLPLVTRGVLAALANSALTSCGGVRYVVPRAATGRLVIDSYELTTGGELFVQGPGMERPVYLRREASGRVVALLARCTHRGCQPEVVAGRFVCPCHGSEFTLLGEVLEGPAERPLTRYPVSEVGGVITVRTGEGGAAATATAAEPRRVGA
jgi:Rieske Fe-S protein